MWPCSHTETKSSWHFSTGKELDWPLLTSECVTSGDQPMLLFFSLRVHQLPLSLTYDPTQPRAPKVKSVLFLNHMYYNHTNTGHRGGETKMKWMHSSHLVYPPQSHFQAFSNSTSHTCIPHFQAFAHAVLYAPTAKPKVPSPNNPSHVEWHFLRDTVSGSP